MKVTIVTVCLNSRTFIEEAIRSVLQQDCSDLEYLILDGGSSDGTTEIVEDFARRDARIRWWSALDQGISHAMNRGLRRATGDIIAFLHADDFYSDRKAVATMLEEFAASPAATWATGGIREVDVAGREVRVLPVRRFSRQRLLRNNIIYHPATFIRRESLSSVGGFDEMLNYAMDYDLWLRLSALAKPMSIERTIACFRVHAGSISSVNRLAALDEEYAVRKRYLRGSFALCVHAGYQILRRCYESRRSIRS